jgi:hypothetical protein
LAVLLGQKHAEKFFGVDVELGPKGSADCWSNDS